MTEDNVQIRQAVYLGTYDAIKGSVNTNVNDQRIADLEVEIAAATEENERVYKENQRLKEGKDKTLINAGLIPLHEITLDIARDELGYRRMSLTGDQYAELNQLREKNKRLKDAIHMALLQSNPATIVEILREALEGTDND